MKPGRVLYPPAENDNEVLVRLWLATRKHGALSAFSRKVGTTPHMVSRMRNGHVAISAEVAKELGYRRVVKWEREDE